MGYWACVGHPKTYRGQLALVWSWADDRTCLPVANQLYLPDEWTADPKRLDRYAIPSLSGRPKKLLQLAFDLLALCKRQVPPFRAVFLSKFYSDSWQFISRLEQADIPYIAHLQESPRRQLIPNAFFQIAERFASPDETLWVEADINFWRWRDQLFSDHDRWLPMDSVGANGQPQSLFADFMEIRPLRTRPRINCRKQWLIYVKNGPDPWEMDTYISNLPAETRPGEFAE